MMHHLADLVKEYKITIILVVVFRKNEPEQVEAVRAHGMKD